MLLRSPGKRTWPPLILLVTLAASPRSQAEPPPNGDAQRARGVAQRLGEQIELAINDQELDGFDDLFDWEALFEEAADGLPIPDKATRVAMFEGFRQGAGGREGLGNKLIKTIEQGGHYTFIGLRDSYDGPRPVFRFVDATGVNYHEYLWVDVEGRPIVVDFYIYAAGERFSETIGRTLALFLPELKPEHKTPEGGRAAPPSVIETYREFVGLFQQGKDDEVLASYAALPEQLKIDKGLLNIYLQAAMRSGDPEQHLAAIQEIEKHYAGDPMLLLTQLDATALRGDHEKCLAAIDRLDERLGGDPYLDLLRAETLVELGRLEEALKRAKAATAALPDYEDAHWTLIYAANACGRWDEVVSAISRLETDFEIEFEDLRDYEEYDRFVESPQGLRWLESRGYLDAANEPVAPPSEAPVD